jgi:hypothetical protein
LFVLGWCAATVDVVNGVLGVVSLQNLTPNINKKKAQTCQACLHSKPEGHV